jgi:hypothetical protein
MCRSLPHTPQWLISMSTSSSCHFFGSNLPHCMLPLAADLSTPSQPSNCEDAMIVRVLDDCKDLCGGEIDQLVIYKKKRGGALISIIGPGCCACMLPGSIRLDPAHVFHC